jgi:hypothetical protein
MKKIVSLLAFALLFSSAFTQKFKPLDCGVTLSLVPAYSATGARSVFLNFATNDVYECSNNPLGVEANTDNGKIFISIKGMAEATECDNIMGPAKCRVDLTQAAKGKQKFTLYINKMLFNGDLEVTENSYHLMLDETVNKDLVHITNPKLFLLPGNAVWGKVEYSDPSMKEAALHFFDDLKTEGARGTQLEAGNYGEVYLHQKGETEERKITGDSFDYPFVFEYDGDIQRLILLVDMYGQRFAGKLRISLVNATGTRYSAGNL